MPVIALPAEDADMDRLFAIASDAFARNEPIWDSANPSHWTAAGRVAGGDRLRRMKHADPHTIYVKAVDITSGQIWGVARWSFWQGGVRTDAAQIPAAGRQEYDSPEEEAYAKTFRKMFLAFRDAAFERTGGNVVSLNMLAVDPAHQRKGVGDVLVKWGLEKADKMDFEAVVESSVFGKGLYEKNGFVFQQDVEVRVPGHEDRPPGTFAWLTRAKKSAR